LVKATNVDGIYSADPRTTPDAEFYEKLTYHEVLTRQLRVLDPTAVSLLIDNAIPLKVIALTKPGNLARAIRGEQVGTLIS
jgi:uridylate kinase